MHSSAWVPPFSWSCPALMEFLDSPGRLVHDARGDSPPGNVSRHVLVGTNAMSIAFSIGRVQGAGLPVAPVGAPRSG